MPKTTRADEIIKKAKRTDREKFETLKKKKHGTPKKVTSKPSTKRARIGSVKRTLSALERDSGASIIMLMHTPNKKESTFRTRSYGPLGKQLVKQAAFNLCKLQFKTLISQFESTRSLVAPVELLHEDCLENEEATEAIKNIIIEGKTIDDLSAEDSADSENDVDRIIAKKSKKKSKQSGKDRPAIIDEESSSEDVNQEININSLLKKSGNGKKGRLQIYSTDEELDEEGNKVAGMPSQRQKKAVPRSRRPGTSTAKGDSLPKRKLSKLSNSKDNSPQTDIDPLLKKSGKGKKQCIQIFSTDQQLDEEAKEIPGTSSKQQQKIVLKSRSGTKTNPINPPMRQLTRTQRKSGKKENNLDPRCPFELRICLERVKV